MGTTPSPVTAQLPSPQPRNNSKKWFYFILIFLILLMLTSALYLWFNSPNPTPNSSQTPLPSATLYSDSVEFWKTYQSEPYNFSIKYPPELQFEENNSVYPSVKFSPPGKKADEIVSKREIIIVIESNEGGLTAQNYWQKQIKEKGQPNRPTEPYALAGLDAIKVESFGLDHIRIATIIIATKTDVYTITFNEYPPEVTKNNNTIPEETFNKILSSFKVLE